MSDERAACGRLAVEVEVNTHHVDLVHGELLAVDVQDVADVVGVDAEDEHRIFEDGRHRAGEHKGEAQHQCPESWRTKRVARV